MILILAVDAIHNDPLIKNVSMDDVNQSLNRINQTSDEGVNPGLDGVLASVIDLATRFAAINNPRDFPLLISNEANKALLYIGSTTHSHLILDNIEASSEGNENLLTAPELERMTNTVH